MQGEEDIWALYELSTSLKVDNLTYTEPQFSLGDY